MASGQHQPLNRLAGRCAREGVALSLSTLADQVGAVAAALAPLHALIAAHVMAAGRLHGDDTTVPPPAKGKTETARLWTCVRDGLGADRRRRLAVQRPKSARRPVVPLARPQGRASATTSRRMAGHPAGRRRYRLQRPVRRGPETGADPARILLGACAAEVFRAGRHRRQRPARQKGGADLAAGAGGRDPRARLADVLARSADTPMSRLDRLPPWNRAAGQKPIDVKAA